MPFYKFRTCLFNTHERSLFRDLRHVALTAKSLDVLEFFLERAGEVVSKDQIIGNVWDGSFVEESNLPVHISKLRRGLGETRENRFIETIQGVGYRFVAPVQTISSFEWERSVKTRPDLSIRPREYSLAVIPLENESQNKKNDYLADGLTEILINALSRTPGLRVIGRNTVFQYKNRPVDFRSLGRLDVGRALTGRIRWVGSDIIISVELTDCLDGRHVWGETYRRPLSEILSIQYEVVKAVSESVLANFFSFSLESICRTENAESHLQYLKGSFFLAKKRTPDIYKAVDYFLKSVSLCGTNASAHVGLVEAFRYLYISDNISRNEALDQIGPRLDDLSGLSPGLDEVQLAFGKIDYYLHWKPNSAAGHFREALTLNPNSVEAHAYYADVLLALDRIPEALTHCDLVLTLDPISVAAKKQVARALYGAADYVGAIRLLEEVIDMEPADFEALVLMGAVQTEFGDLPLALARLNESFALYENLDTLGMIGYVHALSGNRNEARRILERLTSKQTGTRPGNSIKAARLCVALGEFERAYNYLEKAHDEHEVDLCTLPYDPRWKTIRSQGRFQALVRRVDEALQ